MAKSTGQLTATTARRLNSLVTASERRSGLQLSIDFVRGDGQSTPPLVKLLRGEHVGRGGEVRLKLWLTLAFLATKSPYNIRDPRPTNVWAQTLGLQDPMGQGSRRVGDAIYWLHDHGFVIAKRRQGKPADLQVLYPQPVQRHRSSQGRWVTAPVPLWSEGWIVTLSASALVLFLDLTELTNAGKITVPRSMDTARRREYGLSNDTWARASRELEAAGLITTTKAVTEENYLSRRRTTYVLNMAQLNDGPTTALGKV